MQFFFTLLKYVLLFTALMVPGVIMGKTKRIDDEAKLSLTNILTDIAMPFLVFAKLLVTDVSGLKVPYIIASVMAPFFTAWLIFAVSCLVFRKKPGDIRYQADRFCAIFPNCGFIGLPLASAIYPNNPEVVLYVSLFNITSTYLLLSLGIYTLSESTADIKPKKLLTNSVLIAVIFGLGGAVLSSKVGYDKISVVGDYANTLAQLATPLSMLVLGYNLSRLSIKQMVTDLGVYSVAILRLIASPFIMIGLLLILRLFIPVDNTFAMALLLCTAVSTAGSSPAIAGRYGKDSEHAAVVTIGNTLLSVATIPVICSIGNIIFA